MILRLRRACRGNFQALVNQSIFSRKSNMGAALEELKTGIRMLQQ